MNQHVQAEGNGGYTQSLLQHLKADRDRFVAFAFANADILMEIDEKGAIHFCDGAVTGLLGYAPTQLQGQPLSVLFASTDAGITFAEIQSLDSTARLEHREISVLSRHKDKLLFHVSGFRLAHMQGHTFLSLSLARGSSAEHAPRRDMETGLLKKEGFIEAASQKLHELQESGEHANLTLIDFGQLQGLLDKLPADKAHLLLQKISDYLREKSVGGDMAGAIDEESYSIIHTDNVAAEDLLDGLNLITKAADPAGEGVVITMQTVDADLGKLSSQDSANALLYTLNTFAQRRGEAFSLKCLSDGYQQLLEETVGRIARFKDTLAENAFNIAFQPIVDLQNGIIHHYESLVRLTDSATFKNPFEFITFGEQAGMIGDFDLLMFQRTIDVLNDASKRGNFPHVSVNVSGKSLSSSLFMDTLTALLDKHQKFCKQIIVEVTESAKIKDLNVANEFIQKLRGLGVLCCLDDFGSGESSFEYLRNLQVDFIKIDGSYVRESLQDERGRALLRAMSGLCKDLNIATIGEMIEDEFAASFLSEAGVKFGQGYLFGKPEIDVETLVHCKKPVANYKPGAIGDKKPAVRAMRMDAQKKQWWAKKLG